MVDAASAEPQARHLPLPLLRQAPAALSEHALIAPEGDISRRRHAHTACVLAERKAGRLPTEEEWRRTQPRPPSLWRRLRSKPELVYLRTLQGRKKVPLRKVPSLKVNSPRACRWPVSQRALT